MTDSSERSSSSKEAWHEVADRRPGRCPAGRWIVARRRGADTLESHRSGFDGAARPRSHGDAGVGHGGRGVLQPPGVPGEDRSPRQDRAVAGRALARDRPEELHLLPQARGALPQRTRAQSRRREVRDRARHEPGDEASVSAVLRVHRRHHRQGRLHHHVRAEEPQPELPDQPRPPGLGDLPERGGGHPQERADRDRALQDGRVGARRPYRAGEERRLPREGIAEARPRDLPLHRRPKRGDGRAQGRRRRRVALRPGTGARHRSEERRPVHRDRGRHHQRRGDGDEQLAQALHGRARAPRGHARRRSARGAEGRDVRDGQAPRLERRSAEPVLRRPLEGDALRRPAGQAPARRGGVPERLRDHAEGHTDVQLHGAGGRDHRRATGQGRHPGPPRADRVDAVAEPGLAPERLRHDDHRPRRGLGHRELRQPAVLFPVRQPEVPGDLQAIRGGRERHGAARALRADAEAAGGGPAERGHGRGELVEDAPAVWLFMHPRLAVAKKGVQGLWKDLPIPSADLSEVSWAPAK